MTELSATCKICNIKFQDSVCVDEHKLAVHKIKPVYICKLCGLKTMDSNIFDWHLGKVHGTVHWDVNQSGETVAEFEKMMVNDNDEFWSG